MENGFVITKKEKRGIILRLYLTVLGLIGLGIATAVLIASVPQFNRWFFTPESTPEKPEGTFLAFMAFVILPVVGYFYFRLSPILGNNGKLNIAALLSILTGCQLSLRFYSGGWQQTSLMLAIAFALFSLAVLSAILIKKDYSKYKKHCILLAFLLVILPIVFYFLDYTGLDAAIFYAMSILGCVWVFLDVQDLWFKLEDIPDQWNLDRIYCHTMVNLLAGFWLIHVSVFTSRLLVKLIVSPYVSPLKRNPSFS